jgi:serine/threonine protein kinase
MAYYDGERLAQRIRRGPFLRLRQYGLVSKWRAGWTKPSHNIIHRDIKASNTIINRQGLVKIVDFGLGPRHPIGQRHVEYRNLGSAAYMSRNKLSASRSISLRISGLSVSS